MLGPYNQSHTQVAIIGCGNFAFSNIAYYLSKRHDVQIRGVMDIDIHKAASLLFNMVPVLHR